MIPLFVLPCTLLMVLASSTSGSFQSLRFADHHPVSIWDERERQVTPTPVMTESWDPSLGKQLPGERPRETAET